MNKEPKYKAVEVIFRNSMRCHKCFEQQLVEASFIDIAQPRWIGPNYFSAVMRIALVLLNPGAGNTPKKMKSDEPFLQLLYDYRNGKIGLANFFSFQRQHMLNWGTPAGRFVRFYIHGMGLELNSIALANIAWCANLRNKWPRTILSQCFQLHTIKLLQIINPNIIVLSGSATHCFSGEILRILPNCRLVKTLHYAHREGQEREQEEFRRVRYEIASYSPA